MKRVNIILLLLTLLLMTSCSIPSPTLTKQLALPVSSTPEKKEVSAPYEVKKEQASPVDETRIELSDGAGIVIPASALSGETTVKVERNPEKAQKLPPLDDGLVPVSNFYNFEISGSMLNDRVDLILPFDKSLIPKDQNSGILVAAIPDTTGWKYVPVEPNNDKIDLWTDQIGDPIIAWNFIDEKDYTPICDPYLDVQVDPQSGSAGTEFTVVGRVKPFKSSFLINIIDRPERAIVNIPISISLSPKGYLDTQSENFSTVIDQSGYFSYKFTKKFDPGWWYIRTEAKCEIPTDLFFKKVIPSEGRVSFRVVSEAEKSADTQQVIATAEPKKSISTSTATPVLFGAIQVPDLVGFQLDEAIKKLEDLGFGVTWIDGKSTKEVGQIYRQEPVAGKYYVPHRTTVLLYRTIEKQNGNSTPLPSNTNVPNQQGPTQPPRDLTATPDLSGCDSPQLTPEEKANCGNQKYKLIEITAKNNERGLCNTANPEPEKIYDYPFSFRNNTNLEKIGQNKYKDINNSSENVIYEFTINGFIYTSDDYMPDGSLACKWIQKYEIVDK